MEEGALLEKIAKIKMPFRILILLGTIALLGGLYTWLVVLPKKAQISKTKEEIVNLEQKLNQAKIRARNLKKFKAELAKVDAEFKQALRLLPDKKEIPSLLRSITQLGSESNLEFRLFQPKKERVRDFYVEIPVSIEVSGTYHNVAKFFDKVGKMERIVNILNVSMKPLRKDSEILITKCSAVTYRFKGNTDEEPSEKRK